MIERRFLFRWAAGALVLAGCGVLAACSEQGAKFQGVDVSQSNYAQELPLADHNGQQRRLQDFRGKAVVVFFGYTQCPDVCPTSLQELVEAKQLLGAEGERLQGIFVTVDPERDTPALLKEYMANFGPDFLALVPTPEELRKTIAPGYRVYYKKVPGSKPEHYTMDHTAGTLLIDKQGRMRLHSNYGAKPELVAADVKALLAES